MREQTVGDLALPLKNFQEVLHSDSLRHAAHALRANHGLPLVVMRHGAAVGVVTERELILRGLQAEGAGLSVSLHVSDVMAPVHVTITEDTTLAEVLEAFAGGVPALPMMRQGQVVGVIRAQDLVRLLAPNEAQPGILDRATTETKVALSSPIWQELLYMLAEAGI
ncbi:MAG: CBS domain-containing protein [Deltaproteobacteria bacterium]|nr:CBS domain-containing protein [Deltaproteobacteria bacterium]